MGAGAGADFFTTAFLAGPAFFAFFADGAFTATFFPAAFLEATFFAGADFAAALCKRQRFFVAAMILFMPSALIRRLGLGGFAVVADGSSISPLILAHRAFWAKAIFLREAALNLLRLRTGASGVEAGSICASVAGAPTSRSAASARSMAVFCRVSCVMILASPSVIRCFILVCVELPGNHSA